MKTKTKIGVALLLIVLIIVGSIYLDRKSIDDAYHRAITFIEDGSYEDALRALEMANPEVLSREDFWHIRRYEDPSKFYKNTIPLYAYALAQIEYNGDKYLYQINDYLELIPRNYSGELSEEIKKFREEFEPQYAELVEKDRKEIEAVGIKHEKEEKEYLAELKNKIPYEGMYIGYIHATAAGEADKHTTRYMPGKDNRPDDYLDKYYWYADDGKSIVLIVECEYDFVTKVTKYFEGVYWTSEGTPNFGATKPKKTTKKYYETEDDDPYNVNDYSDPEDFYYDNYDDFWEYEEAEDYYNRYHDDP